MKFKNKIIKAPKYWLIISSILNIFGLIALYSISQDEVVFSFSSRFTKFLFWFLPAISVFILFFYLPIKTIHDHSYLSLFVIAFSCVLSPLYFGSKEGCILRISPLNLFINFLDRIFINPARQIN